MGNLFNQVKPLDVPFSLNLGGNVGFKNNIASGLFSNCAMYDAPFNLPDSVEHADGMFYNCPSLNSPIHINPYGNLITMTNMFTRCPSYNQDINIPINCTTWQNFYYYQHWNDVTSNYDAPFNANVHIYANGGPTSYYNNGRIVQGFSYMYGFNGNIIFHSEPTNLYEVVYSASCFNSLAVLPETATNLAYAFYCCYNLNQNIQLPQNCHQFSGIFSYCENLNQNILFPDSSNVASAMESTNFNQNMRIPRNSRLTGMFSGCRSLNYPLYVPNYSSHIEYIEREGYRGWDWYSNGDGIFSGSGMNCPAIFDDSIEVMSGTFSSCNNFDCTITMPSNLKVAYGTFSWCFNFFSAPQSFPEGTLVMQNTFAYSYDYNGYVSIPSTVQDLSSCFFACHKFNQPVSLPSVCFNMVDTFGGCGSFNQPVTLPSALRNGRNCFSDCLSFNQVISLPEGMIDCYNMFYGCRNLYLDEAIISSTAQSFNRVFYGTKIMNINIRASYSNNVGACISLERSNVSGKSKVPLSGGPYDWLDNIHSYSDWISTDWGVAYAQARINNNLVTNMVDQNYLRTPLIPSDWFGGGYSSFADYQDGMNTWNRLSPPGDPSRDYFEWFYNFGGFTSIVFEWTDGDNVRYDARYFYADYPNATSEATVNYYRYDVSVW